MARKILFVTGRLAAPSLQGVLDNINNGAGAKGGFFCSLCELPISVAALMIPSWALSHLERVQFQEKPDMIVMPGRCSGDIRIIEEAMNLPVVRGPEDLWDIPSFMGVEEAPYTLQADPEGVKGTRIIAEIVDAWRMSPEAILYKAEEYRRDGADYIDLGGSPDGGIPDIEQKVILLKDHDFLVAVDSFHRDTLIKASCAGADMLLSINASNLDLLDKINCPVVVIPDCDDPESKNDVISLDRNMDAVRRLGKTAIADPILSPPLMGFVPSLCRFLEYRTLNPDTPMLMGAGNITELLEADSTGVNALLAVCLFEMGIDYVLTTEVASWTRGTIKEMSLACSVMRTASGRGVLPRNLSKGLRFLKGQGSKYKIAQMQGMQADITDENWRVFVAEDKICAFNREQFLSGDNIETLFAEMQIKKPDHAFYIGKELQKAAIALELRRDYVQDHPILWGVLS